MLEYNTHQIWIAYDRGPTKKLYRIQVFFVCLFFVVVVVVFFCFFVFCCFFFSQKKCLTHPRNILHLDTQQKIYNLDNTHPHGEQCTYQSERVISQAEVSICWWYMQLVWNSLECLVHLVISMCICNSTYSYCIFPPYVYPHVRGTFNLGMLEKISRRFFFNIFLLLIFFFFFFFFFFFEGGGGGRGRGFSDTRFWHFMQTLSFGDNLHKMSKPILWE